MALALSCLLALSVASWSVLQREIQQQTNKMGWGAVADLNHETVGIQEQLNRISRDALFLSKIAAVDKIGQVIAQGGSNWTQNTALVESLKEFENTAVAFMSEWPDLLQLRLIDNGGNELARIEQTTKQGVSVVPADALQNKRDRPYVQEGLKLPISKVYLSEIDLNQEHGKIQEPHTPVIRAVTPVVKRGGETYGVLVVNQKAEIWLNAILSAKRNRYLTDADGHFLAHPKRGKAFSHQFDGAASTWTSDFKRLQRGPRVEGLPAQLMQEVVRDTSGEEWLVVSRTVEEGDSARTTYVLREAISLRDIVQAAQKSAQLTLLILWGQGLLLIGWFVVQLQRSQDGAQSNQKLDDHQRPERRLLISRLVRLVNTEVPRPRWQLVGLALLPLPVWVCIVLMLGQGTPGVFVMLVWPVAVAAWLGSLQSGVAASLLASIAAWDLSSVDSPPFNWSLTQPLDIAAALSCFFTGVLISVLLEAVRVQVKSISLERARAMAAKNRLLFVTNHAPVLIAQCDRELRYRFVNEPYAALFGRQAVDTVGLYVSDLLGEQAYRNAKPQMMRALAGESVTYELQLPSTSAGEQVMLVSYQPERDDSGQVIGFLAAIINITDRKAAEAALLESEAKYRDLWENSRDAQVMCFPPEWNLRGGNDAAVALFGATDADQLANFTPEDLSPERQLDGQLSSVKAAVLKEQALKNGSAFFEWQHRPINGLEMSCEVFLTRITLEGRTGVQGTIRDVSERKANQSMLLEFKATVDNSLDAVFIVDANTLQFNYVNHGACLQVGYSPEQLLQMHPYDLNPDYPEAKYRELVEPLRSLEQNYVQFETVHRHNDGHELPVEVFVQYISLKGERPRYINTVRDISERKAVEAAERAMREREAEDALLRESEAKFRSLFDQAPDGIMLVDLAFGAHIVACNKAAAAMLGGTDQQIIGLTARDISPVNQPSGESSVELIEKGIKEVLDTGVGDFEWMVQRLNGETFWAGVTIARPSMDKPTEMLVAWHDLTSRIEAEQQLRQQLQERETLLDEIHHRVKNNLQVVTSLLSLQQRGATPEVAAALQLSCDRISAISLIHEQLYGGEWLSKVDMRSFVERLSTNLSRINGVNGRVNLRFIGSSFTLNLAQAVPCALIVNELITNAFKHAFPDNHVGTVTVELHQDADGTRRLITRDDGVGLSMTNSTKPKSTMAIGLALLPRMAQQMGAKLEILSLEAGTGYELKIPPSEEDINEGTS